MREGESRTGLVKSRDLYLSVFDRCSPVNRPGEFDRAWKKARLSGHDITIWAYNQYWIDRQELNAIQAWILILDGIFKVEVRLIRWDEFIPVLDGFLGMTDETHRESYLECQSGELVVASLTELGDRSLMPLAVVPPGRYRAAIKWDYEGESEHWDLKDFSQYPSQDGPDGVLYLQRADPPQL